KDLFQISAPRKINDTKPRWYAWVGIASFALLLCGITGLLPLFHVCLIILTLLVLTGILDIGEIRRQLDLSLLMVLVCSLAMGVALDKSGVAGLLAEGTIMSAQCRGNARLLICPRAAPVRPTSLLTPPSA